MTAPRPCPRSTLPAHRPIVRGFARGIAAGLAWAAAVPTLATAPPLRCAALLTVAELRAISSGSDEMSSFERGPGHTECAWSLGGSGEPRTLSMTFWEPEAMADSMIPADSPEEFFEMQVKSAEDVRGTRRETLKGVGLGSALFRDGAQRTVFLLTRAGVAYFVAGALSDAEIQAVAKAIAAP